MDKRYYSLLRHFFMAAKAFALFMTCLKLRDLPTRPAEAGKNLESRQQKNVQNQISNKRAFSGL